MSNNLKRRMRIQTALKNQTQQALATQLGLSQSYIHKLSKRPDCWIIFDEHNAPSHIQLSQTKIIRAKRNVEH